MLDLSAAIHSFYVSMRSCSHTGMQHIRSEAIMNRNQDNRTCDEEEISCRSTAVLLAE